MLTCSCWPFRSVLSCHAACLPTQTMHHISQTLFGLYQNSWYTLVYTDSSVILTIYQTLFSISEETLMFSIAEIQCIKVQYIEGLLYSNSKNYCKPISAPADTYCIKCMEKSASLCCMIQNIFVFLHWKYNHCVKVNLSLVELWWHLSLYCLFQDFVGLS